MIHIPFQNDVNNLKDEMINEIREKIRHLEDERTQPASYIMADFCNMHKVTYQIILQFMFRPNHGYMLPLVNMEQEQKSNLSLECFHMFTDNNYFNAEQQRSLA